jgi:hypothetical protein
MGKGGTKDMDTATLVRVITAVLAVVVVGFIIARRKSNA